MTEQIKIPKLNKKAWQFIAAIIVLVILNIFLAFEQGRSSDFLKVHFLDVGQGDAIFIETPNGKQILIDAGQNGAVINQLSKVMPLFDRTIDIAIASHSDADHVGGFPTVLERYNVLQYFDNGFADEDDLNNAIKLALQNENNLNYEKFSAGQKIVLDTAEKDSGEKIEIILTILWPATDLTEDDLGGDNNERSIVARLDYGETSFLFTGDAGIPVEDILIEKLGTENILDIDILKAGHHGSKTSTGENFLKATTPELTIISAGFENKFGHPHQEVVDRIAAANSQIKNTALHGRILIESDGINYWVKKSWTDELFDQSSFFQSLISTILIQSS